MNPLITVILPIYNMEAYLARCLDSVCASTYRNLEIICIDDGSRDRSLEILRNYEQRDSRIIVIAKENGGVSSARNAGLDRMNGKFVTFIDPDDFIHPQMIELLYRAEEETNADIVICNHQTVREEDLPISFPPLDDGMPSTKAATWASVFKNYFHGAFCWGRLISGTLVQHKRFPEDLRIGEDSVFFTSLWDREQPPKCCVLDAALYYYLVRVTSAAHNTNSDSRIDVVYRFLDQNSAEYPFGRNVNFVFAITRLMRHAKYYSGRNHFDKDATKKLGRIMRKQVLKLIRSPWFTAREKLNFLLKAFIPRLKNPKTLLRKAGT